jgi:DNA-binding response OmpR family regulator
MFEDDNNTDKLSGAQILILQGEGAPRIKLNDALFALGSKVTLTALPGEALALLTEDPYDALVLDLDCVHSDDLTFLQNTSKVQPGLPIVILTSRPNLLTAIEAVRISATDYLIKPVKVSAVVGSIVHSLDTMTGLKHQITRLIRKAEILRAIGLDDVAGISTHRTQSIIIVPPIRVDPARRMATLLEDPPRMIDLSRGELAVLVALMSNPNLPQTTEQLARHAWNYDLDKFESRDLVRPYIHRLRRKLENNRDEPSLILTIRGQGYLFASNHLSNPSE